ncbi:mechanosensitive ion channel family protein [Thalassotalea marina]|uniref:Small-conductance mechanosensitive channel n=1 Tax=Thalassotalea marina TaxID=1673741 RepID=A0A919BCU7_9GAMM|nr:mechanosensitive ion channel domain-containing protein [Thalassotalea marina]GHF80071.1 mechanosensitive ion channel protein [Thalassotalea marina]
MDKAIQWISDNQELLLSYLINIVIALLIFVIGKWVAKLITGALRKVLKHKNVDNTVSSFICSLTYGLLVLIAFIAAISHLGFNTTSLVAIVGAAGLAIGLALQGSLSNFASGILLITFKPFKAGDFVEVAGKSGIVEEVHVFSTKLRTPDNKTIIVPNGAITGSSITNFSTKDTRRIDLVIGVSYDANLAETKEVLTRVINNEERILKEPAPTIGVLELADSSVNFAVRPWVKSSDYWPVYFDLLQTIKEELDNAGIEIPFPQMSVHINQENTDES